MHRRNSIKKTTHPCQSLRRLALREDINEQIEEFGSTIEHRSGNIKYMTR